MTNQIAISVKSVSKDFYLPHEKVDSLKSVFVNPFKLHRGGEVQHALKDISFDVKKGEFFGIVGRNGSGKSTLLKIIANIYRPSEGSIGVEGKLVPFIELGVGFNPELTGRENTFLNGALMGFSQKQVQEKYDAIVKFAELRKFMDQKLRNYSSGMQVRLAFSVATILAESDILLIDEVLAVGDAEFQRKCYNYFKGLKRNGKTVVFVSHDMDAISQYCDRAILIDESTIKNIGTPENIAMEYKKLFIPQEVHVDKASKQALKQQRWGYGGVDILNLDVSRSTYDDDDQYIEISYRVKSVGYKGSVIPGVTIKDDLGRSVCGTNSKILKTPVSLLTLKKVGDTIASKWLVPNIFNDGRYSVEPAVLDDSGKEALVWWNDAIHFDIKNEYSVPVHLISPKIELEVERK